MKSIVTKTNNKAAFTIVELLTVMSIIVILIGLLVPALNQVKQFAKKVKQQAQFNSINVAIELFSSEFEGFPDSGATGPDGGPYCGAMKLGEAMVGQDLMGFHPESIFKSDGTDYNNEQLYSIAGQGNVVVNTTARKGPYLPIENANAYRLNDIYEITGNFAESHFVLCDVFGRVTNRNTGKRIGMPILYYKANTANNLHDIENPDNPDNIYNYRDNQDLVLLGKPWDPPGGGVGGTAHKLAVETGHPYGWRFYMNTWNDQVTTVDRPFRSDTYILISAGNDGEYGTADDISNFDWKYKQ